MFLIIPTKTVSPSFQVVQARLPLYRTADGQRWPLHRMADGQRMASDSTRGTCQQYIYIYIYIYIYLFYLMVLKASCHVARLRASSSQVASWDARGHHSGCRLCPTFKTVNNVV